MAFEAEDFDVEEEASPGFGALFVQENGSPMIFSIQDEEGIEQVSPLIKGNGGQLVSSVEGPHTIQLLVAGHRPVPSARPQFKHTFIQDSVNVMQLQKLADYSTDRDLCYNSMQLQQILLGLKSWQELQLLPRQLLGGLPPSSPPSPSSWSSEDEEDRQRRAQSPAVHLKRKMRREFTHDDRLAIVRYILKRDLASQTGGRHMWEIMAKAKVVPGHTWQSLKEHYRRKMVPKHLPELELTAAQMKALAATGSGASLTPVQPALNQSRDGLEVRNLHLTQDSSLMPPPQCNDESSQAVHARRSESSQAHHLSAMKSSSNIPGTSSTDNEVAATSSRQPSHTISQVSVRSPNAAGGGASDWLSSLPKKVSSRTPIRSLQVVFTSLVHKTTGEPSSSDRDESSSLQQEQQHYNDSVTATLRSRQSQESQTGLGVVNESYLRKQSNLTQNENQSSGKHSERLQPSSTRDASNSSDLMQVNRNTRCSPTTSFSSQLPTNSDSHKISHDKASPNYSRATKTSFRVAKSQLLTGGCGRNVSGNSSNGTAIEVVPPSVKSKQETSGQSCVLKSEPLGINIAIRKQRLLSDWGGKNCCNDSVTKMPVMTKDKSNVSKGCSSLHLAEISAKNVLIGIHASDLLTCGNSQKDVNLTAADVQNIIVATTIPLEKTTTHAITSDVLGQVQVKSKKLVMSSLQFSVAKTTTQTCIGFSSAGSISSENNMEKVLSRILPQSASSKSFQDEPPDFLVDHARETTVNVLDPGDSLSLTGEGAACQMKASRSKSAKPIIGSSLETIVSDHGMFRSPPKGVGDFTPAHHSVLNSDPEPANSFVSFTASGADAAEKKLSSHLHSSSSSPSILSSTFLAAFKRYLDATSATGPDHISVLNANHTADTDSVANCNSSQKERSTILEVNSSPVFETLEFGQLPSFDDDIRHDRNTKLKDAGGDQSFVTRSCRSSPVLLQTATLPLSPQMTSALDVSQASNLPQAHYQSQTSNLSQVPGMALTPVRALTPDMAATPDQPQAPNPRIVSPNTHSFIFLSPSRPTQTSPKFSTNPTVFSVSYSSPQNCCSNEDTFYTSSSQPYLKFHGLNSTPIVPSPSDHSFQMVIKSEPQEVSYIRDSNASDGGWSSDDIPLFNGWVVENDYACNESFIPCQCFLEDETIKIEEHHVDHEMDMSCYDKSNNYQISICVKPEEPGIDIVKNKPLNLGNNERDASITPSPNHVLSMKTPLDFEKERDTHLTTPLEGVREIPECHEKDSCNLPTSQHVAVRVRSLCSAAKSSDQNDPQTTRQPETQSPLIDVLNTSSDDDDALPLEGRLCDRQCQSVANSVGNGNNNGKDAKSQPQGRNDSASAQKKSPTQKCVTSRLVGNSSPCSELGPGLEIVSSLKNSETISNPPELLGYSVVIKDLLKDWDTGPVYILHNSSPKFHVRTLVESGSSNNEDEGGDFAEEFEDEDESSNLSELDGEQDHSFEPPVCGDRRDDLQAEGDEAHADNPSSQFEKTLLDSSVPQTRLTSPMTSRKKKIENSLEKSGLKRCPGSPSRNSSKSVNVLQLTPSNSHNRKKAKLRPKYLDKSGNNSSGCISAVPETDSEEIPFPSGSVSSAKTRRSSSEDIFLNSFGFRALNVRRKGGVPFGIEVSTAPNIESRIRRRNVGGSCIQDDAPLSCENEDPVKDVSQKSVRNSTTPVRKRRKLVEESSNDDDVQELRLSDSSSIQFNSYCKGGKKCDAKDGVGYVSPRTAGILSSGSRQKSRDDYERKSHHVTFSDEVEDSSFFSHASVSDSTPTQSHASIVDTGLKTTLCEKESVSLAMDPEEHGSDVLELCITEGGGELYRNQIPSHGFTSNMIISTPYDENRKGKRGQLPDEAVPVNTLFGTNKRGSLGAEKSSDQRNYSARKRSMRRDTLAPTKLPLQKHNCSSKSPSIGFTSGVKQQSVIKLRNGKRYFSPARKNASVYENATSPSKRDAVVCETSAGLLKTSAVHYHLMPSGVRQDHHHENDKDKAIVAGTCRKSSPILETLNKSSDTIVESRLQPIVLLTPIKISASCKLTPPMIFIREVGPSDQPGGSSIRVSPSKTPARFSSCSPKSSRETALWLGSAAPSLTAITSTLEVEEDIALPTAATSNNITTLSNNLTSGDDALNVQVKLSDKAGISVEPRPSRKEKIVTSETAVIAGTSHISSEATKSSKRRGISIKVTSEVQSNFTGTCRQVGEKPTTKRAADGNSDSQDKQSLKRSHSHSSKIRAAKKVRLRQSKNFIKDIDVRKTSRRILTSSEGDNDCSDSNSDSSSFTSMANQFRCNFDYENFDNFTHLYDRTYHPRAATKSRAKRVEHRRPLFANHRKRARGPQYSSDEDASLLRGIKILNPKLLVLGGNKFWRKMEKQDDMQGRSWQSLRTRYHHVLRDKLGQLAFGPEEDLALIARQLLKTHQQNGHGKGNTSQSVAAAQLKGIEDENSEDERQEGDSEEEHHKEESEGEESGCSRRQPYTKKEDLSILRFLLSSKRYREVGGREVWKRMSADGVRGRSWQSLKERFRKRILPRLCHYQLTDDEKTRIRDGDEFRRVGHPPSSNSAPQRRPHAKGRSGDVASHPALKLETRRLATTVPDQENLNRSGDDDDAARTEAGDGPTSEQDSEYIGRPRCKQKETGECSGSGKNPKKNQQRDHDVSRERSAVGNSLSGGPANKFGKDRNAGRVQECRNESNGRAHKRCQNTTADAALGTSGRKCRSLHHRLSNVSLYQDSPANCVQVERLTKKN